MVLYRTYRACIVNLNTSSKFLIQFRQLLIDETVTRKVNLYLTQRIMQEAWDKPEIGELY